MLERTANRIKAVVDPMSRIASYLGAAVLVLIVILTVADVIARRAFNSPITGVLELTSLGLVVFVFLTLAYCGLKGGHVVLDILVVRFPQPIRAIVNTLILALTTGILGVASWQLWVQALRVQRGSQTSGSLEIPIYPFLYVAVVGTILLAITYLVYLLHSLKEIRK